MGYNNESARRFNPDRPLFVKVAFNSNGRRFNKGAPYPWKTLGVKEYRVAMLHRQNFIHHNGELETSLAPAGDGLELMNGDQLSDIVKGINDKVKQFATSAKDRTAHKCKSSKVDDKQRGLIRTWRTHHGNYETME